MTDVKNVIALLCKYLHLSIGSSIKPEYFRLAKYNKDNDEVTRALWETLHMLSRHVVKYMHIDGNFDRYDDIYATKLYFAFLQYPTIEFYALSSDDITQNRELLLALGWLFAQKNVLNIVVREKIASSILGHEYSSIDDSSPAIKVDNPRLPLEDSQSEMKRIVSRCGSISHNIKEIAELVNEKIKLTTKIHGASLNTSGLPHLSVYEVALAKKSFAKSKPDYTKKDEELINELHSISFILDTHMRWKKKEHVFYDWMVTVIEENKKDEKNCTVENRCGELSNFLSLLRHVTKKKMHSIKNGEINASKQSEIYDESCVSRFLRTQPGMTEAEIWNLKTAEKLNVIEIDVDAKMNKLTAELRKMLKSIPNCVEI